MQFAEEQTKKFYHHDVDYCDDIDDNNSDNDHLVRGAGKHASVCQNKRADCHLWTEMLEKTENS